MLRKLSPKRLEELGIDVVLNSRRPQQKLFFTFADSLLTVPHKNCKAIKINFAHCVFHDFPRSGWLCSVSCLKSPKTLSTVIVGLNGPRRRAPPQISRKKGLARPKAQPAPLDRHVGNFNEVFNKIDTVAFRQDRWVPHYPKKTTPRKNLLISANLNFGVQISTWEIQFLILIYPCSDWGVTETSPLKSEGASSESWFRLR